MNNMNKISPAQIAGLQKCRENKLTLSRFAASVTVTVYCFRRESEMMSTVNLFVNSNMLVSGLIRLVYKLRDKIVFFSFFLNDAA